MDQGNKVSQESETDQMNEKSHVNWKKMIQGEQMNLQDWRV